jgi:hypothetical protein
LARDNYSYKKYQRELAKKKKREEKALRKLNKNKESSGEEPSQDQGLVAGQDQAQNPEQASTPAPDQDATAI